MKNTIKMFGIIALVAVTVFSLAACGDEEVEDQYPSASDFDIGNLLQTDKDNVKPVTITPKSGKSSGTITIYYDGVKTLPAEYGAYNVTFDVAAVSGWQAATLYAGKLIIGDGIANNVSELATLLSGKPANTKNTPYVIILNSSNTGVKTTLNAATDKYVYLVFFNNLTTSISDSDFQDCTTITGVSIGKNVTSIGLFQGCTNLTEINIADDNPNYASQDGVLYNKDKTRLFRYPAGKTAASFTIPNSVTSFVYRSFAGCTNLTSVTIGSGVTDLSSAFADCTSLTSVTIPANVTGIGTNAFQNCTSLASISIPNNVTGIGAGAFSGCTSLANITIPNNVIGIGIGAFMNCTSLASATIGSGVTNIGDNAFKGCTKLKSVKFEGGNVVINSTGANLPFLGDLVTKYNSGKAGTYTTSEPVSESSTWTKQP